MKTVRSFANEEDELNLFYFKLEHTWTIFRDASFVYGSWMLSSNVSDETLNVLLGPFSKNVRECTEVHVKNTPKNVPKHSLQGLSLLVCV